MKNENVHDVFDLEQRAHDLLSYPPYSLMLVLGFVAVVANIMGLIGITQVKGGSSPRVRLILSLGCSDILCGLSNVLYIVFRILMRPIGDDDPTWCYTEVCKVLVYSSYIATLLNLLGMAIDHYIAIMRPLHYTTLMSKKRATLMIVAFWVTSFILGFSDFLISIPVVSCRVDLHKTVYDALYAVWSLTLVCFVIMLYVYLRIYQEVRKHQKRAPVNSDFHNNKKGLITTLLILGTFFVCWVPAVVLEIVFYVIVFVKSKPLSQEGRLAFSRIAEALLYLSVLSVVNAICDPVIYMTRTAEIRQSCSNWSRRHCSGKLCNRSSSGAKLNGTNYAIILGGRSRCFSNASLTKSTMDTVA